MLKAAKKDLARSGLTVADAEFAEMYSVADASEVYPDMLPVPGLVIPYYDPWTDDYITFERDGEEHAFCRVRYFHPEPDAKSFTKRKQIRYGQPSNSGVHPYFPLVEDIDWLAIAEDPTIPLMITEGEKKALRASIAGVPTIGLGGVYNFTHDGELLPILDKIDWDQRPVYLCYDSDAVDNTKIQVAEGRLATELSMKRNASVFLVRLPEMPGGAKMGVDDFIVSKGEDALFDILDEAPEMRKIDREVLRMNADCAWIAADGLVLDLRTDQFIKKSDFIKGSDFSTRTIVVPNDRGKGVKVISVADRWLTHPHARRYSDTVFRPGTTDKAIAIPGGGIAYNRFRGLREVPGDVQPFFDLYYYLMKRTDEFDKDMIWKLIAYKMQNLEARVNLGIVMVGKQGSGKSLLGNIIADMVKPYSYRMSTNELESDYNPWIETSLIVVMNEAKSFKLRYNMSKLNTYVTDELQPMNDKYRKVRTVQNNALYIFNSNERSAAAFSDDDRRFIVLLCPDKHPDLDEFYGPIFDWYHDDGPAKLLHWMRSYDLKGWKPPIHAPDTREKRMAYYASLTPVQKVGEHILRARENVIAQWIKAAIDWAVTTASESNPYQMQLAAQIQSNLQHIQVRPFYTPEELAMLFPSIAGTYAYGKIRDASPANRLAQELIQLGVDYLRCTDNFDGFMHKGQLRQFLVVADHDEWRDPITQDEFDELMQCWPTYSEYRSKMKRQARQRNKED